MKIAAVNESSDHPCIGDSIRPRMIDGPLRMAEIKSGIQLVRPIAGILEVKTRLRILKENSHKVSPVIPCALLVNKRQIKAMG